MSCAEKNQSRPPSFPISSLPEDVVVDIVARVLVCDYPRLSRSASVSLVSSSEIYERRSSVGCTEHCLYENDNGVDRLYTLRRKDNDGNSRSSRLVLIPGLPDMPLVGSFVAVGSKIYVFGGNMTSSALFIDCSTSHTVQHLPEMPVPMSDIVADVIGGRIYVFGCIDTDQKSYAMVVFDTETQTWEDGMTKPVMKMHYGCLVVMSGKIYMRNFENSSVYDPKESNWETEEVLNSKRWSADACVVDDVLYFYDFLRRDKELRAYDPERKCWQVVRGLDDLLAEVKGFWGVVVGNCFCFMEKGESWRLTKEICCAEISLQRRKGG